MKVDIDLANHSDLDFLLANDHHIDQQTMRKKIEQEEIIVVRANGNLIGWLRYSYFWDTIPFMNLLWIEELYRNQGIGSQLVAYWQEQQKKSGKKLVMTSTLANERAQHLYRRLGYKDKGALFFEGEAAEIILVKSLEA